MSDISPFYFTLTIHLMAILMVILAIQFIGVACLMNHVILFLGPLKMKDWLLRGIKSSAVNQMNFASECTLSAPDENAGTFIPWNVRRAALQRWLKRLMVSLRILVNFYLYLPQTGREIWCHFTICCRQVKTVCCRVPHFIIIYLWRSRGEAFS